MRGCGPKPSKCWPSTKDEVAKQLLLRGLQNPGQALVSTAKAVQLLAHDDHGAAIPVAHQILGGNYDLDAKEEALRALVSDPELYGSVCRYSGGSLAAAAVAVA